MEKAVTDKIFEFISENDHGIQEDPYKNKYHLMAPVGLINDPNGLIFYKGLFHVFFQWSPFETFHAKKYWGHYTSPDLITWSVEKVALSPDQWFDKDGCYSGSAIEKDGKLFLFYTGNVKNEKGERETYQCLAVSNDGFDFTKKGPIIYLPDGYTAHFRDPKVFREKDDYYMLVGAQNVHQKGEVVLYRSIDLYKWQMVGTVKGSEQKGLGYLGYMWECPDIIKVEHHSYILFISPQGFTESEKINENQSYSFVGDFDFTEPAFHHHSYRKLDYGFDFFAPQVLKDPNGRHILFAWMGPGGETVDLHPTIKNKWIHTLTIPREIELIDGKVYQNPIEELKILRNNKESYSEENRNSRNEIHLHGASRELELEVKTKGNFQLTLSPLVNISFKNQEFLVERQIIVGSDIKRKTLSLPAVWQMRMFIDQSTVEIFLNEGEYVFSLRHFSLFEENQIVFQSDNDLQFHLNTWEMEKMKVSIGEWDDVKREGEKIHESKL